MEADVGVLRLVGPLRLPAFTEEYTYRHRVDRKGVVTLCCTDVDTGSCVHVKTDGFVAVCEFAWRTTGAVKVGRCRDMEEAVNAFIENHHGRESPELVLTDQQYVVQCVLGVGKNCTAASCKVRRVCDVPVIKSALYSYLRKSGFKRFGRILLRYDRTLVPGWMRMEIQDRKRADETLVFGTLRAVQKPGVAGRRRDDCVECADELSRLGTRAAAREAKRRLWGVVGYYRALEACYASWVAQTRIDERKLLHLPLRIIVSDRTRKDQVNTRLACVCPCWAFVVFSWLLIV